MEKTALVAGGAGFIGSHLCERLLNDGWRVVCVDNLLTGSRDNIADLEKNPSFIFVNLDITKELSIINSQLKNYQLSIVVNLASPASPKDYQKYPIETLTVGSIGTKNLLELVRKHKARFVHASTSEVYGDPTVHPQKETYWGNVNPYGTRSMYDEAKRYAEALVYVYRNQFKLNTGIVRVFNTYGPKMKADDGRVVSNFIVQALKEEPITVYGDGNQSRSFCCVDDMIEGLVKMIGSDAEGPINLGNPDEFTIKKLADKVIKMTKSSSKIICKSLPPDDPARRCPDITKAKQELNWQPKIELDEGLQTTIEWLKNQLSIIN